ncbi:MAG: hypothetical protein IT314_05685, partial [Anaerolineales bacterium]|nr:hypothetical protein [Anaerolineales bacterium]
MKLFKKFSYIVICASLLTAALGVQPVYAASIVVNSNADDTLANLNANATCDLREAITNANNDNQSGSTDCAAGSGADAITFAGNYVITLVGSQLPAVTSQITITGNGAANTIVQADAAPNVATYRVFEVSSSGNLTLDGLTVQHGRCNGACAGEIVSGGGITNDGTLVVTNSALSDNSANRGGGIFNNFSGTLSVANSTISGNSASVSGGGIFNLNIATVTNSTLSGNSTVRGGGIYNYATLTVTDSTFSGNSATITGGGIYNYDTLTVTNSSLSGNSANSYGGGIYNYTTLTVTNSTLSGNSAGLDGGGILNDDTLTVTNSTLSGNSAGGDGGGIENDDGDLTVTNSTLSGNSAGDDGGGIYTDGTATVTNSTLSGNSAVWWGGGIISYDVLTVTNSTLSGNSAGVNGGGIYNYYILEYSNTIIANSTGGDCYNGSGVIGTNVNNLVKDGSCSATFNSDPNLAPLADNGGPTQTHALLAGSSAIDTGNAGACPSTDQRGVTRPQGAVCDIGAYEYSSDTTFPTVVFTNLIASYAAGAGPSNFTINYSENVYDPAGNANPDDVTNPANYLLVEDGADNAFDTLSCAGGLVADDTQVAVTGVTYNAGL